jgi:hypothetical protein
VFTMMGSDPVDYRWNDGYLQLKVEELAQYEGVVISY